jgi:gliding motility-associated-like protein
VDVTINGCSTSDTIDVSYKPLPIVNLGNDTTLCDGETLILDATNSGATYLWQDNSTNATFMVTQADTFYVAVDLNGCIATDTIIVDYQEDLSAVFVTDTILFCAGEELTLDATVQISATYLWSDNSTESTLTVNDSAIYWVEISTQCDTLVDSIQVDLKNCACDFEVPNVFTPNSDGVNDYFYPIVKCQLLFYKMSIYNRWGDLIYNTNQPLVQWDGIMNNGKKASEGSYSFIIEYRDNLSGQDYIEKGSFMLMH